MKRALLIGGGVLAATLLAVAALLAAEGLLFDRKPKFSNDWGACAAGETCVAVAVPCGWTAVSERHRAAAEAYFEYLATVVELRCRAEEVPSEPPPASCRAGRCVID